MVEQEVLVDYWVPHKEYLWLPGKLSPPGAGNTTWLYNTEHGEVMLPSTQKLEPIFDEMALEGVDDICLLNDVSDASLLHSLYVRYRRDEIYTNISCVLVAVNPFKPISNYSSDYIEMYHEAQDRENLKPHIYNTTAQAFLRLSGHDLNQAVLISGESGAGKTETTKYLLLYVSEVLKSEKGLEDKLLELNPILEGFGNAKTTRNDNSSRFGKWIEVLVNPSSMSLGGASVTDYLLEVTRVCDQGAGERNYHIFYQLVNPKARELFPHLQLGTYKDYKYLNSNPEKVLGRDDGAEFLTLRRSFTSMKFSEVEEDEVFKITAAILHLGNVEFNPHRVDKDGIHGDGSVIKDEGVLQTSAELFGFDKEELSKAILFKRRETGKEIFMNPLDPEKATNARDSIAKLIYGRLFKWLVLKCNDALQEELRDMARVSSTRSQLFFGVLDIAGFEFFQTNRLEQLFINLSNEKLQQFFNNVVFKAELAEYEAEGVPMSKINYVDNADVLELLEGKGGILLMLDDAVMGVKQTDLQYNEKLIRAHDKHAKFFKPKFVKDAPLNFGIRHYAGEVMYTTDGFLEKSISTSPPEVLALMSNSNLTVLNTLAKEEVNQNKHVVKKPTVGALFRKSLAQLLDKLNQAEANFVRCIKPNAEKKPNTWDAHSCMDQLRLSGVLETVKIRKAGFLMRPKCLDFLRRYLLLLSKEQRKELLEKTGGAKKDMWPSDTTNLVKACRALLDMMPKVSAVVLDPDQLAMGKTKVFIKSDLYASMEKARRTVFGPPSLFIQCYFRGYRTRKIMKEVLEVNEELKKCVAKAGQSKHKAVIPLKSDVRRATVMETALVQMDVLLDRALKFPIKLPNLPVYSKARAHLAAQSTCARHMQESKNSVDVPAMQALIARAAGYGMEGELIDMLKARCDELMRQNRLRRLLMNCAFSEVIADAEGIVKSAQEAGLDKAEAWALDDGYDFYTAAVARVEELRGEQKEKLRAMEEIEKQVHDLKFSTARASLQAVQVQCMTYDMQGPVVDALNAKCIALDEQGPYRRELQNCLKSSNIDEVRAVVNKVTEAGLHKPEKWILDDGPKLFARAQRLLLGLQQMQVAAGPQMYGRLQKYAGSGGGVDEEEALLKVYREESVQDLLSSMDIPSLRSMLGQELADELRQRCTTVLEQLPYLRKLQLCHSKGTVQEVEADLAALQTAGLSTPDQWILPEGPTLLASAQRQCNELKRAVAAGENLKAGLEGELQEALQSFDVGAMQAAMTKAMADGNFASMVESLKQRCAQVQAEKDLRSELRKCTASGDLPLARSALAHAQEDGHDKETAWILPDGFKAYRDVEYQLRNVVALKEKMACATTTFDREALREALTEADNIGLPDSEFADERQLFLQLSDSSFVENKIVEIQAYDQDGSEAAKVQNLMKLVDDPDHFNTCKTTERLIMNGTMENVKMRETGFLMRPTCADFIKRYICTLSYDDQWKVLGLAGCQASVLEVTPEKDLENAVWELLKYASEGKFSLSEVAVSKSKVFLKPGIYRSLEASRRSAILTSVVKVQAAWRGYRKRKMLKPVIAVDRELNQCFADESLDSKARLEKVDGLLIDAVAKQTTFPKLKVHAKTRGTLAKQVGVAQEMESAMSETGIAHIQALLARATACGMTGAPAEVALRARCEELERQRQLMEKLRGCMRSDDEASVKQVVSEAQEAGLTEKDSWLLSSGYACYAGAMSRLEQLEGEGKSREGAKAQIEHQMAALSSSVDVQAIKLVLAQALSYDIKGDLVDRLKERCDAIQSHVKMKLALMACEGCDDQAVVQQVLDDAKAMGLDNPDAWLLPEGPQLYSRACDHIQRVEAVKARIRAAGANFDAHEMQEAFKEADELGLSQSLYEEEYNLFLQLQDPAFVEWKVDELNQSSSETDWQKIPTLLELVKDPDGFDSCPIKDHLVISGLQAAKSKEESFIARPTCAEFVSQYSVLVGAKSSDYLPPGTDPVAAAQSLAQAIDGMGIPDLPANSIVVGKSKVFLKPWVYQALQTAKQKARNQPVTKMQSAWRGHRTRRALKDVRTVETEFSSISGDTQSRLAATDKLLERSVSMPVPLPRLQYHFKERSKLAMQADIEQLIQDPSQGDSASMQALIEQARLCGLEGPLVEQLQKRCNDMKRQQDLRLRLKKCMADDDAAQIQAVLAEVRAEGLGTAEAWMVQDGASICQEAERELERLNSERQRSNAQSGSLQDQITQLQTSTNVSAIKAIVAQPELFQSPEDPILLGLIDRCNRLQEQHPHHQALRDCLASTDKKSVEAAIAQANEGGLGTAGSWVIPEGPKTYSKATKWLQHLTQDQQAAEQALQDIDWQCQGLQLSLDSLAIKATITRARRLGCDEIANRLSERSEELEKEQEFCQNLETGVGEKSSLQAACAAVQEWGLGDGGQYQWLTPDGPRLVVRAALQQQLLEEVAAAGAAADESHTRIASALQKAAAADDIGALRQVLAEAEALGLKVPSKWSLSSGPSCLRLAEVRLAQLEEKQEEPDFSIADREWQRVILVVSIQGAGAEPLLGDELMSKVSQRCAAFSEQSPPFETVLACLAQDRIDDVSALCSEVQGKGLSEPGKWVLEDGPRLYQLATERHSRLQEQARIAEAAVGDIERQMQELSSSSDLASMLSLVARAEHANVNKDMLAALKARSQMLQKQVTLRKGLQGCPFNEDLKDVQRIIADVQAEGLDKEDKWVLLDGPKLFARAISRLEDLQEVENLKGQIGTAATKFDAKALHTSFLRANELGMRQEQYAEAHEVYLNLQDSSFVESKSQELQSARNKDDLQKLMIANLASQLETLQVRVDTAGMKKVAQDIVLEKKSKRSVFDAPSALQRKVGSECFQDLSNFSKLRDPLAWGTRGKTMSDEDEVELDPAMQREAMLQWTDSYIAESLTRLESAVEQQAIKNFTNILRCMGDKPSVTIGDREEPVIRCAKKNALLCDEVYVQVLKQLTANPGAESCTCGWALLQHLIEAILPSEEMCEFLRGYLEKLSNAVDSGTDASSKRRTRGKSIVAETEERGLKRTTTATWQEYIREQRPKLVRDTLSCFMKALAERN